MPLTDPSRLSVEHAIPPREVVAQARTALGTLFGYTLVKIRPLYGRWHVNGWTFYGEDGTMSFGLDGMPYEHGSLYAVPE